jgi:ankyrin repeat protein
MLVHLLKTQQIELAKSYIQDSEKLDDINVKDAESASPITYASEQGYYEIVEMLLAKGASVFDRADMQRQPLHKACSGGHLEIVKLLIKHGADIFEKDCFDFDALVTAVQYGHLDVVNYLLSIGASPHYELQNAAYDKCTPLIIAATTEHRNPAVFQQLINAGADINHKCALGLSALHVVVEYNDILFVRLLLQNGADPNLKNKNGSTPLFAATRSHQSDIMELLIQYGARINEQNILGYTPLITAVIFQRGPRTLNTVKQLLLAGADPNIQDSQGNRAIDNTYCPIVKKVLERWSATKLMIVFNELQLDWYVDYDFWAYFGDFSREVV